MVRFAATPSLMLFLFPLYKPMLLVHAGVRGGTWRWHVRFLWCTPSMGENGSKRRSPSMENRTFHMISFHGDNQFEVISNLNDLQETLSESESKILSFMSKKRTVLMPKCSVWILGRSQAIWWHLCTSRVFCAPRTHTSRAKCEGRDMTLTCPFSLMHPFHGGERFQTEISFHGEQNVSYDLLPWRQSVWSDFKSQWSSGDSEWIRV